MHMAFEQYRRPRQFPILNFCPMQLVTIRFSSYVSRRIWRKLFQLMRLFEGQVAIVTGASRGIGKAIARQLATLGARVAIISHSEMSFRKAAEEIRQFGGDAYTYAVDVSDYHAVQDLGKRILAEFQRVDILVNNAGIARDELIMRMSLEQWDEVLDVNLKGAFNFIKAVSRSMIKRRSGRIINITSVSGVIGNAGQANYATSKGGLIGLTKSVAREFARRGITVNAIAPGFIDTDMTAALQEGLRGKITAQIPMGRMGKVEEVASVVAFLASSQASYITGQVVAVDGGLAM